MGPLHRPICPIYECDLILLLAFYYTTTAPKRHHFQDNEQQRDNRMAQSLYPQNCLEDLQCIMTWTGATHGPLHTYAWENSSMSMCIRFLRNAVIESVGYSNSLCFHSLAQCYCCISTVSCILQCSTSTQNCCVLLDSD